MLSPQNVSGDYNSMSFAIQQALAEIQTATLVRIVSCTNAGGLSPVGFVDVLPLVNQVDGKGNATPHVAMHNLPYLRIQGGSNAVIIDPQAGDIGIAIFASRDISKVKTTKAPANPGSWRRHDFSDGLYLGGVLNGAPIQYFQFTAEGINIVSPTKITLSAPLIEIDGQLSQGLGANGGSAEMLGPVTVTNDVTATGTSTHTHVHGGVQSGSSNTGEPV